jgi:hypothetical protein
MPHLRELVERHKDQPFAVIGINYNDSPSTYRNGLEKFGVTWISAYQGKSSPISNLYKVSGHPTYFLMDQQGKIVASGHNASVMDGMIEKLLKKR